jgi:hypothetical protein
MAREQQHVLDLYGASPSAQDLSQRGKWPPALRQYLSGLTDSIPAEVLTTPCTTSTR